MAYYFRLSTCDEQDNNFITLQDNLYGGPLIYWAYLDFLCPTCRSIDKDALFRRKDGLEGGPKIRVGKGREIADARDGFLCMKTRVVKLVKKHRVTGWVSREIPYTDWHVIRITTKVAYRRFKPEREKPPCKTCGRGAYYGLVETLSEIDVPKHENTFFAPKIERGQSWDVFMTEKVARMLKAKDVKGGRLDRLFDDEENHIFRNGTPSARRKIPEKQIFLT